MSKRILIIDDETIARQRIVRFLNESGVYRIEEAENGLAAIEKVINFKPDVVFLDIQMPGLNGFEVLQQFEERTFQVIFQTAFDEFALKAFEESACDYLLKPFTKVRFEKALGKALDAKEQQEALSRLQINLRKERHYLEKITFKHGSRLQILSLSEIVCIVSQNHCTVAYTTSNKEYIIDFSIAYLSEHLSPIRFLRCHRNSIIAVDRIKSIGGTKDSIIKLDNGMDVPLSRSKRVAILDKINQN